MFDTIPILIFSGKIADIPPVTILSPILILAVLGISFRISMFISNPSHSKLPKFEVLLTLALIFEFKLKYDQTKKDWEVDSWDNKTYYFSISLLLLITSTAMGKLLEDPIISTVSMVSLFFPAVTLIWPNHVRHIKRVQFYPLFTLAMFTCVRAPWFLILLGLLFFTIRSVNYLKYAIIYPSFGVAQEETIVDV